MKKNFTETMKNLVNVTQNYIPVGALFDVSGSMNTRMSDGRSRYEASVEEFIACLQKLQEDEAVATSVFLFLSLFGHDEVTEICAGEQLCEISLESLEKQLLGVRCTGNTPMGAAVSKLLDRLQEAKRVCVEQGAEYSQPVLVIVSDGEANDPMQAAFERLDQCQEAEKLLLMPIGIGEPGTKFDVFDRMLQKSTSETPVISSAEQFKAHFHALKKTVRMLQRGDYVVPGAAMFSTTPLSEFGLKRNIEKGGVRG